MNLTRHVVALTRRALRVARPRGDAAPHRGLRAEGAPRERGDPERRRDASPTRAPRSRSRRAVRRQLFTVALPAPAACSGDTADRRLPRVQLPRADGHRRRPRCTFSGYPVDGLRLRRQHRHVLRHREHRAHHGPGHQHPDQLPVEPARPRRGFDVPLSDLLYAAARPARGRPGSCARTPNGAGHRLVEHRGDVHRRRGRRERLHVDRDAGRRRPRRPRRRTTTTASEDAVTTTTKPHATTTTTTDDPATTTTTAGGRRRPRRWSGSGRPVSTPVEPDRPVERRLQRPDRDAAAPCPAPVRRCIVSVGLGLFAIGAGMMLIGLDLRWKARGAFVS